MNIGDTVSLTANAVRGDGTVHQVPLEGVIDHIESTRYGPRFRVRHSDGTCTVVDDVALAPQLHRMATERRRMTAEEYAATWI